MNVLKTKGDAPLSLVPKNEIYPELQPANADAEAARYKADVIYAIKTIQGVWCALARDFDVVVAVMVGNRFGNLDGNAVAGFDHGAGNHCVHADGLYLVGSELTADGANSWDVTWGEQGRMGLQTKHFTEPFNYHTFYVVSSVIDDPQGTNPPVAQ
jgi:hypothetical protein